MQNQLIQAGKERLENIVALVIAKSRFFEKKPRRIYHYHIRKTAGTSLNKAFIKAITSNYNEYYNRLAKKNNHRVFIKNKIIVGWNHRLIQEGNYFFGFSHAPFHAISLPENTFTITCLRDPADRLISHYKMLSYYKSMKINHPCMKTEGQWLGNCFNDFLNNIPKKYLENQLFMFSKSFDISEAFDNIMKVDMILDIGNFNDGLARLSKELGINLSSLNEKKYYHTVKISDAEINHLRDRLKNEYELISTVKNSKHDRTNSTFRI